MKRLSHLLVALATAASLDAVAGKDECLAAFNAKNFALAFQECHAPAREGEIWSQSTLARLYYLGEGVARDYAQAAHWFRRAAEQGGKNSQYFLADMYARGLGVTQDMAEALKWYRRSAEQGDVLAQDELARRYAAGDGLDKNPAEAAKWRLLAAQQGHVYSQMDIGLAYLIGEGVEKNADEGVRWLRKAADAGDDTAQYMLGAILLDGRYAKRDAAEGERLIRLSAARGNADARKVLEKLAAATATPTPPRKLSCEDARDLKNTYTPLDLYPAMPDCMAKKMYREAGDIFALAGVYGHFDRLRVRDRSAHQAVSILKMTFAGNLPPEFQEYLRGMTNGEGLAQLCAGVRRVGPPNYFPHYMVQHGLKSIQAGLQGAAPAPSPVDESLDPAAAWNRALEQYLHCPV